MTRSAAAGWVRAACRIALLATLSATLGGGASAQIILQQGLGATPAPIDGPEIRVFGPTEAIPARSQQLVLFVVANDGPGNVTDVVASFRSPAEAEILGGASGRLSLVGFDGERRLGDILENDSEGTFLLVATPEETGPARLLVTLTYRDPAGVVRTETRELAVPVGSVDADPLRFAYDATQLRTGAEGTLDFRVGNPTDEIIEDLTLTLDTAPTGALTAGGPTGALAELLGGDTARAPGVGGASPALAPLDGGVLLQGRDLAPGEVLRVQARVLASRDAPDLVPFRLVATYTADGYAREQRLDYAARLSGSVNLQILELREVAGQAGTELTGTIVNVGSGTAWNPRLRVPAGGPYGETEPVLVEDLEPNEPVGFRVPVARVEGEAGATPRVEVVYNDEFGTFHTAQVEGTVRALPPEGGRGAWETLTNPWVLVILLGLALLIAGLFTKRGTLAGKFRPRH